jgi:hypothetical protein
MTLKLVALVILQVWPNLGLHLAMVAKMAALLGLLGEATIAVREAVGVLCYTHPESSIFKEMRQLHSDCHEEMQEDP